MKIEKYDNEHAYITYKECENELLHLSMYIEIIDAKSGCKMMDLKVRLLNKRNNMAQDKTFNSVHFRDALNYYEGQKKMFI